MISLRDWWRRSALYQFYEDLPLIDRVTALVVLVLLSAFLASWQAIIRYREPSIGEAPVILDFDAARSSVPA
jgi:hypothetical protein